VRWRASWLCRLSGLTCTMARAMSSASLARPSFISKSTKHVTRTMQQLARAGESAGARYCSVASTLGAAERVLVDDMLLVGQQERQGVLVATGLGEKREPTPAAMRLTERARERGDSRARTCTTGTRCSRRPWWDRRKCSIARRTTRPRTW